MFASSKRFRDFTDVEVLYVAPSAGQPVADDASTDFCLVHAPVYGDVSIGVEALLVVEPHAEGAADFVVATVWFKDEDTWLPLYENLRVEAGSAQSIKVAPDSVLYFQVKAASTPAPTSFRVAFRPAAGASGVISIVAAQGRPVPWRVRLSGAAKPLAGAWAAGATVEAGDACVSEGGKMYVCHTGGVTDGTAGPTGTGEDITDGTAHWSYVAASARNFRGNMVILNNPESPNSAYYSTSAALAPGGMVLAAGVPAEVMYMDATVLHVYSVEATVHVVAYP